MAQEARSEFATMRANVDYAEQEALISELETKLERLRALYDQYFMGFEKIEPLVQRKDFDRRVYLLRREQMRNTALRFRFNQLVARYNTLATHWQRIVRQIENGTYKRDLARAAKRFGAEALTNQARRRLKGRDEAEALEAEKQRDAAPERERVDARERVDERERADAREQERAEASMSEVSVDLEGLSPAILGLGASVVPRAPRVSKAASFQKLELDTDDLEELTPPRGTPVPAAKPTAPGGRPLPSAAVGTTPRPNGPSPAAPAAPGLRAPAPATSGAPPVPPAPPARAPLGSVSAAPPPRPSLASAGGSTSGGGVVHPPAAPPARPAMGSVPGAPPPRPPLPSRPGAPGPAVVANHSPAKSMVSAPVPPPVPTPRPAGIPATASGGGMPPPRAPLPSRPVVGAPPPVPSRPVVAATPAPAPALAPTPPPRAPLASAPVAAPTRPIAPAAMPARPAAAPAPARPPAPAAKAASGDGISENRLKEIYGKLVETKRQCNESTAGVSVDGLTRSLRESQQKLREKHAGKQIDFDVVVKDGKAVVRPIIR
jgi:hypothetical protein